MLPTCLLDRRLGDDQPLGDRAVGAALGHQRQHLALARGQRGRAGRGAAQQLPDHLRVDDRAAAGDPVRSAVDELRDVDRPGP